MFIEICATKDYAHDKTVWIRDKCIAAVSFNEDNSIATIKTTYGDELVTEDVDSLNAINSFILQHNQRTTLSRIKNSNNWFEQNQILKLV